MELFCKAEKSDFGNYLRRRDCELEHFGLLLLIDLIGLRFVGFG